MVAAGGGVARSLVPDELAEFSGDDLWVLLYPSDVALVGKKELVARARAAVAMRLAFAEVYMTSAKESEQIEDRLARLSGAHHVSPTDFRPRGRPAGQPGGAVRRMADALPASPPGGAAAPAGPRVTRAFVVGRIRRGRPIEPTVAAVQ